MTKEFILDILNSNSDYVDTTIGLNIVVSYMKEKNVEQSKMNNIKLACSTFPQLLSQALQCCFDHYKIKFNIIKITAPNGAIIKYY